MEIESLKEKLGDQFDPLKEYVESLIGQRDAAREESISGRKKLKAQVETLTAERTKFLEKLGIDSVDDLESLGDTKGQAEAAKQFEAKVKRLEREIADASAKNGDLLNKYRSAMLDSALEKAVSGHDWIDRDVAVMLARNAIVFDDDTPYYVADGKQMPIDDGIKHLATSKKHLIKSSGTGGSGYHGNGAGGHGHKTMTRASFEALDPQGRMAAIKEGVSVT